MTERIQEQCPFCGSRHVTVIKEKELEAWCGWCVFCLAQGPRRYSEKGALEHWNQRLKIER